MGATEAEKNYFEGLQKVDSNELTPEVMKAIAEGYNGLSSNKESSWYDNLLGTKNGNMFGLNKDQWSGLGTLGGLGKDLYGIFQGGKQADLMKNYYNQQMGIQREQAEIARKRRNELITQRANTNASYLAPTKTT